MQEEIEKQTVALVFKAGKLTTEALSNAMHRALEKGLSLPKKEKEAHGKMTLYDLVGKGHETKKIEFKEEDLKAFHKTASKYNIDYAIHSEPEGEMTKYYVFFQAKDAAAIDSAFKEFVAKNEKHKDSVKEKLNKKKEKVRENKEKQRERTHNKNRNRELR